MLRGDKTRFGQELVLVHCGVLIALFLPVSAFRKLMMIAVLVLVLVVELINSAIEAVVDRCIARTSFFVEERKAISAVLLCC